MGFTGAIVANNQNPLIVDWLIILELGNHHTGEPLCHVIGNHIGADKSFCGI